MVANEEGVEGIRIFKRPLKIKPKDQINDLLLARMQKKIQSHCNKEKNNNFKNIICHERY